MPDMDDRGATGLGLPALAPPGSSDPTRTSWVRRAGYVVLAGALLVVIAAVVFGVASIADPRSLRVITGAILLVLVALTWLLCSHAGGHAWFVPLPALAIAILWALTVSGSSPNAATGWWLVALSAGATAIGVVVAGTALTQRLRSAALPPPTLVGASGTVLRALAPTGVVRVAGETWTARSLSGPLPSGAPVHVVRVEGVRLDVWSEAGAVPDRLTLEGVNESGKGEGA